MLNNVAFVVAVDMLTALRTNITSAVITPDKIPAALITLEI